MQNDIKLWRFREGRRMRIAVLTLTRDRVDYTRHCFNALLDNAGIPFDHFVLDQASEDDTLSFLDEYHPAGLLLMDENVGIHRGWNLLLDEAGSGYDVYVTFDNDCEMTMPGTLAACAQAVATGEWIVTPTVLGLNHPLEPGVPTDANGVRVGETLIVGGICRAMPGAFAQEFRFNEDQPLWGGDESWIAAQFPGRVGWLLDWTVNHFDTTNGQHVRYPTYWQRKKLEMGLA